MSEIYFPFNSGNGSIITENEWYKMASGWATTGVRVNVDRTQELKVNADPEGGRVVIVDPGICDIMGEYYATDEPIELSIDIPPTTTGQVRIDAIVARCEWGVNAKISIVVVDGAAGAPCTALQMWDSSTYGQAGHPPIVSNSPGVEFDLTLAFVTVNASTSSNYNVAQADILDQRQYGGSGSAQTATLIVAAPDANPTTRANADFIVPYGYDLNGAVFPYTSAQVVLNAAINALPTMGGGVISLTEGTFTINDSILLNNNTRIVGTGAGTVIQADTAMAASPMVTGGSALTGASVRDLSLIGTYNTWPSSGTATKTGDGRHGISLMNASSCELSHLEIKNMSDCGIWIGAGGTGGNSAFNRIHDNYVHNIAQSAYYLNSDQSTILNNSIDHVGTGIYLSGTTQSTISNNTMDNIWITGIVLDGSGVTSGTGQTVDNMIQGNHIYQCSMGGMNSAYGIYMVGAGCIDNAVISNYVKGIMQTSMAAAGIKVGVGSFQNIVMYNVVRFAASTQPANNIVAAATEITKNQIRMNFSGSGTSVAATSLPAFDAPWPASTA